MCVYMCVLIKYSGQTSATMEKITWQSQQASATKLTKKFEENVFWRVKVQLFTWSAVYFELDVADLFRGNSVEISAFREILAYEFVGVLDGPFLPSGVGVREIDCSAEPLGDCAVCGEFRAVVGGYRLQGVPLERQQRPPCRGGHRRRPFVRDEAHEYVVRAPLGERQQRAFLTLADNQVHLPVAETPPVGLGRALVYADASGDVRGNRLARQFLVPPVFHAVPGMRPQLAGHVRAYHLVYALVRYAHAALAHPPGNLPRRPVLPDQQAARLGKHLRRRPPVRDAPLAPHRRQLVGWLVIILAAPVAVAPHLAADRRFRNPYLAGD